MNAVMVLAWAADNFEENKRVAPGLLGFLTIFFLATALILLMLNMTKHLRNVQRSDVEEVQRRYNSIPERSADTDGES